MLYICGSPENKKKFGYPHVLSVQNTKNARERAYKVQKLLADTGLSKGVTLAMQSVDAHTLKEKCNYSKDYRLKFAVQHGLYFGKEFFLPELKRLPNVLVWGKQTKKNLEPFNAQRLIKILILKGPLSF